MQALVVDDSAVYRKLIGDQLRSWGFGVTLAETGSDAWQILEQPDSPKLVLLDWVLPDLDGVELCRRIRKCSIIRPLCLCHPADQQRWPPEYARSHASRGR